MMLSLVVSAALISCQSPVKGFTDYLGRPVGTHESPIVYHDKRVKPFMPVPTSGRSEQVVPTASELLDVRLNWKYWVPGAGIGATGMEVTDLNGDGKNEIVAASAPAGSFAADNYWAIWSRKPDGSYGHSYVSDVYSSGISCLRVFDYNNDGKPDVGIASGSRIFVYDGPTHNVLTSITTVAAEIRGLNYIDVDSDGQKEFVFCDASNIYVYNAAAGALESQMNGYGGYDVVVGNVDSDSHNEIVVGRDTSPGYVIDGISHAVKWTYNAGFGAILSLADVSGDGIKDVIGANRWYYITAFDANLHSPVWQVPTSLDIGAMKIADVDKDGRLDLIYGDDQWGSIHALDAQNTAVKWAISNPLHGVTDIAIGDLDGDHVNEVVFGAGYSSTGEDSLLIFDGNTRAQEFVSKDIDGPFYGIDAGDIDADGQPELLFGSYESDSGYDDGLWFLADTRTRTIEFMSGTQTGLNWNGLWRVKAANVDADPQREVFVSSSSTYSGFVICYDGVTHAEQFRTPQLSSQAVHAMTIADVDADGQLEIVVAASRTDTGATGSYIYVYNASTGVQEWRSPISIGQYWANFDNLRLANVDSDANMEIIAGDRGGAMWVFDGTTHVMKCASASLDIQSLDVCDVTNDGIADIIVGDSAGTITVRDSHTGNLIQTLGNYGGRIDGLRVRNIVGSSAPDLVFCVNGLLNIVYKDGSNTQRTWTSPYIAANAGYSDSIYVGDIDGDARTDIVVNAGVYGLNVYRLRTVYGITP